MSTGNLPEFEAVQEDTSPVNATFIIVETTPGVSDMASYVLTLGGVAMAHVEKSATADDVCKSTTPQRRCLPDSFIVHNVYVYS